MIISRLHFLLLFVFGIVDSNTALGQGNEPFIVGRVWEATSKAPAKFANVYFKNSGLGTIIPRRVSVFGTLRTLNSKLSALNFS